jgi:hypothetical protein
MRNLIKFAVAVTLLSSSLRIMGQSPSPETSLPKEIQETSVTVCWIEYPLRKVFADLEAVKPGIIDTDATVSLTDLDTPITLEIIDVGFEQVLKEILSPIGLTFKVEDGTVIVGQSPRADAKPRKTKDFISEWYIFSQISLPTEMLLPHNSKKRHGLIYLGGRIEEVEKSLEGRGNKKIHRWISSRPQITIRKQFMQNKELQHQSRVTYRCVPVVELVSDPDNQTEP